jgi:hypothetical protein
MVDRLGLIDTIHQTTENRATINPGGVAIASVPTGR